jgi:hypothetical protein
LAGIELGIFSELSEPQKTQRDCRKALAASGKYGLTCWMLWQQWNYLKKRWFFIKTPLYSQQHLVKALIHT